ncbi:o-succinylbenzoate--CoA ligase [Sutcliffiella halmapala]|uniref:o-succinylbenzoate--CoA ligase n=1 Tax=Sutcliffiella halmapala TaxID=79882 RepID=UPI000994E138|nr:o-succinylbenzoate--CoA ligase [Sutcliffiella halmapala]
MVTVPNFLVKRASLTPNRIAYEIEEEKVTFADLHNQATIIAGKLAFLGVKKGDIISIFMKNSIELVEVIFALKHIGAITVLHNLRLTSQELAFQMEDAGTRFLITDEERIAHLNDYLLIHQENILSIKKVKQSSEGAVVIQEEFDLDSVDTIMYTSGTTGHPKGVKQTYGNHFWSATGSALNLGLHENDAWLAAVPLFHISGLSILMRGVIYGMRVILHERFDGQKVNLDIRDKGVTIVSVVSTMLRTLLDELGEKKYPSTFRCMLVGGGPVPLPMLEECEKKEIPVFQTYGMTETCSQIVTLSPEAALTKIGSAGKALFPCQLKIMDEGKEAAAGHAGEIVVKGPNVTPGYFQNVGATNKAMKDGWFHTGDIGFLDEDGFLFVLDRRSDLIISGGENVYPAEIESVLLAHPGIKDVGVTGVDEVKWGQVPIAFVVKGQSKVMEEEVLQFVSQRLAGYKVPKRIILVDSLPRNAANKLLRRKLVELLPVELDVRGPTK